MKHTPTPWAIKIDKENEDILLLSFKDVDNPVIELDNTKNNLLIAKFIVKAVNNHERLLNALKNILPLFDAIEEKDGFLSEDEENYKDDILIAIKQAESEE